MEFRIVSIRETRQDNFYSSLELELENTQPANTACSGEGYKPEAHIIAVVPNTGEFHGLTIGKVLTFGNDRAEDKQPGNPEAYIDPCRVGHWKSPEVRITKAPESGYFTYDRNLVSDYNPGSSSTGLPPSGLASEAIEPNECAAELKSIKSTLVGLLYDPEDLQKIETVEQAREAYRNHITAIEGPRKKKR